MSRSWIACSDNWECQVGTRLNPTSGGQGTLEYGGGIGNLLADDGYVVEQNSIGCSSTDTFIVVGVPGQPSRFLSNATGPVAWVDDRRLLYMYGSDRQLRLLDVTDK